MSKPKRQTDKNVLKRPTRAKEIIRRREDDAPRAIVRARRAVEEVADEGPQPLASGGPRASRPSTASGRRCRQSSGFPLLALDGPIRQNAKKLGLSLVELDL
jgi:hypothetical protein